ncbi:MAG: flagellar basal body-associated FliL family protein [Methyloprofundus sp.]|nr:flagellar basal body-associated FliL family protein [Methyloprofundus sp.]
MRIFLLLLSFLCVPHYALAGEDEATEAVVEYLAMTPKFTVNLAEPKKYLRVDVQLMVEGDKSIEKVKIHFPAIRHGLIMLFSGKAAADLQTMEQRETLREEALKVVKDTLEKYAKNSDGLRDLFFTEFLVQ